MKMKKKKGKNPCLGKPEEKKKEKIDQKNPAESEPVKKELLGLAHI